MKVGHGLTRVWPIIDHQTKTGFIEAQALRDFGGFEQEVPKDLMVVRVSFGNPRNSLFRNDQHMAWRLGFYAVVPDGEADACGSGGPYTAEVPRTGCGNSCRLPPDALSLPRDAGGHICLRAPPYGPRRERL